MLREVEIVLDDRAMAVATVRAERRPDREGPRTARHLRAAVAPVRLRLVDVGQVGGAGAAEHRREQRLVADEREPVLVRNVEPLMAVGDDRVGSVDTVHQVLRPRRQRREQPEGAVDVEPGAVALREVGHLLERVEVAGVHLARAADRRSPGRHRASRSAASIASRSTRPTSSRASFRTVARPTPSMPSALMSLGMRVAAADHRDRRRGADTKLIDVDARTLGAPPSGAGERDEVGHRRAGREHAAHRHGQSEELLQPVDRDLFQPRGERRRHPRAGVLVEGRGEPVGT